MISLFGKEEFDPPRARKQDPWTALKLSGFWVVLSILQVALSVDRISSFRSSGRPVSGWREATAGFWVAILMFWLWNSWSNFRKYQDQRHGDEATG